MTTRRRGPPTSTAPEGFHVRFRFSSRILGTPVRDRPGKNDVSGPRSAVTPEFGALVVIAILCFSNLAFFYGFYNHLEAIGVPSAWRGPLLAMEPITALIARPILSVFIHPANSGRAMAAGAAIAIVALLSYPFATGIPTIALVRVVHGAGYVMLATGLVAAYTQAIPPGRAAWAYGLLSLAGLLPAAALPPIIEIVQPLPPHSGDVYAFAAPLVALVFPLLAIIGRRTRGRAAAEVVRRPSLGEILTGLRRPGVAALMSGYLIYVAGHTIVYFFIKSWSLAIGAANPGVFFLSVNATTIGARVLGMGRFDKMNPARVAGTSLLCLAVVVPCFAVAGIPSGGGIGPALLDAVGALYGLCLGLGMPLFNAAMYRLSPPELRGVTTNLMMTALDAGFILGPLIGGAALASGLSLPGLFAATGGLMLIAAALTLPVGRLTRTPGE